MSGRSAKRKGSRVEREIVKLHLDAGIPAMRVPLSGAMPGFKGDVLIGDGRKRLRAEVKARKGGAGFVTLEKWKGSNDVLILKRDREEPMVVLGWSLYIEAIREYLKGDD